MRYDELNAFVNGGLRDNMRYDELNDLVKGGLRDNVIIIMKLPFNVKESCAACHTDQNAPRLPTNIYILPWASLGLWAVRFVLIFI